ncbi:MAG: hypothetical protein U5R14_01345 [Gemmatimonadota bacterium]|nr:hypothetical protein [Gemmatimonadota bacterium]
MDSRILPNERRLARRLGALVLALFHLTGAVALPAADGQLDVEQLGTPVHVESEGRDDCTPHHDHAFCQLVRTTALATPARPAVHVEADAVPRLLPGIRVVDAADVVEPVLKGSSGPRAPPAR